MKTKKKAFGLVFAGLCLFAVTLAGTFALYSSQIDGDTKTSVAAFAFDAKTSSESALEVSTAESGKQEIGNVSVTNQENDITSEVSTKYSICLVCNESLPETITLTIERDGEEYTPSQVSSDRREFTFTSDDYIFPMGDAQSHDYTVLAQWENEAVTKDLNLEVTARVIGEQVD